MDIINFATVIEILIFIVMVICIILLIKMIINRRKMVKLDKDLSHITNINNLIKDEKYLEMTLPFTPFV